MEQRMESALAFIGENLAGDLSDKEISRHLGITPTHLCRLFKAELGEAPMQHVHRLRMKLACELLLSDEYPHLSIKEIAAKVGCNDGQPFRARLRKAVRRVAKAVSRWQRSQEIAAMLILANKC